MTFGLTLSHLHKIIKEMECQLDKFYQLIRQTNKLVNAWKSLKQISLWESVFDEIRNL